MLSLQSLSNFFYSKSDILNSFSVEAWITGKKISNENVLMQNWINEKRNDYNCSYFEILNIWVVLWN